MWFLCIQMTFKYETVSNIDCQGKTNLPCNYYVMTLLITIKIKNYVTVIYNPLKLMHGQICFNKFYSIFNFKSAILRPFMNIPRVRIKKTKKATLVSRGFTWIQHFVFFAATYVLEGCHTLAWRNLLCTITYFQLENR